MGDAGTLLRLNASVRHPNIVGDPNVVSGSVTPKWVDGTDRLVEVQLQNRNLWGANSYSTHYRPILEFAPHSYPDEYLFAQLGLVRLSTTTARPSVGEGMILERAGCGMW